MNRIEHNTIDVTKFTNKFIELCLAKNNIKKNVIKCLPIRVGK